MEIDRIIETCKEALECIARLTPFPMGGESGILLSGINEAADYADKVREKLRVLITELEAKKKNET